MLLRHVVSDERTTVGGSVEEGLAWSRSSRCADSACVEVAWSGGEVFVRDSRDPSGPVLRFTRSEWAAFVAGVRQGELQAP
jgi:Domain of unknown function (DUF397)